MPPAQFDATRIDQFWGVSSLDDPRIVDQTDFVNARVTLSDDASGTWIARFYPVATAVTVFGTIENGQITVDLAGNYDANDFVGQGDLDLLLLNWGKAAAPTPNGWLSNPPGGIVSQDELDAILLNWGRRNPFSSAVPGVATAIPEPGSMVLVCVLLLVALAFRRRPR